MGKRKKDSSKKIKRVILFLGIFFGFAFMLYPFVSQLYYDYIITNEVVSFQESIKAIDPPSLKAKNIQLAEAYNEALDPDSPWIDPYTLDERIEGVQTYARMLEVEEKIGVVHIPKINVSLPIFAGTSDSVLEKGVGHLEGTSLPVGGNNTHSVLTAHRGLPEARLFTDLDKIEIGDYFSVETIAGELFYQVDQIIVVEPTEIESVSIIEDEEYLTLLTCTPYMINSHRMLVRGKRAPAPPEEVTKESKQEKDLRYYLSTYRYYFIAIFVALIGVVIVLWIQKRKSKK